MEDDSFPRGNHYDLTLTDGRTVSCDDVIEALGLGFRTGHAFKYLWRSAKGKPGEPRTRDLKKSVNFLTKEITGHWSQFGKQDKS